MPVAQFLCEGGQRSPDARVLSRILPGYEIRPLGGKYGMGERIKVRREIREANTIFGLLDGDFREWRPPTGTPQPWIVGTEKSHLGWRWERKEIENYLIDPAVVEKALQDSPNEYPQILERAANSLEIYQACRVALTLVRPRFSPLNNSFGKQRGGEHPLPEPTEATLEACLVSSRAIVDLWNADNAASVGRLDEVVRRILPECHSDGSRRREFLTGFSGKDLLWAMDSDLRQLGYPSAKVFLEKILIGIQQSTDQVWKWLPEWEELRRLVDSA